MKEYPSQSKRFCERVKAFRKARNISQRKLAEAIGMSIRTIWLLENPKPGINPSGRTVFRLEALMDSKRNWASLR